MDAPAAAWLLVGAVVAVLLLGAVLAGVAARRRRPPGDGTAPPVDDLADFLEHPPGFREAGPPPDGWALLAGPPAAPPPVPVAGRRRPGMALAVGCLAVLALAGAAAAVVAGTRDTDSGRARGTEAAGEVPRHAGREETGGLGAVVGDLAVAGLVLEPRAVGITAVYPELDLRVAGGAARLEVRLPAYNCLTSEPPADPVAAGCAATLVEHASLAGEQLRVERDGDRLLLRGRAATEVRPAGSAPQATGRVYELELTVAPAGSRAVGQLRLGTGTASVLPGRSTLRTGS